MRLVKTSSLAVRADEADGRCVAGVCCCRRPVAATAVAHISGTFMLRVPD
jgi:hypothetical protein